MRTAPLRHTVFVYGTLKKGFSNYDAILSPGIQSYEQLKEKQHQQQISSREDATTITTTNNHKDNVDTTKDYWQEITTTPLCQQIRTEAWIPGLLFADAYFCPYLVLPSQRSPNDTAGTGSSTKITLTDFPLDDNDDDAASSTLLPTVYVQGEIYNVNDSMLARLDELEGVHKGRYTRSAIQTLLRSPYPTLQDQEHNNRNDDDDESMEAFVYHLAKVPSSVVQKFKSISSDTTTTNTGEETTNPTEKWQIDTVRDPREFPVGREDCIQFISCYRLDEHSKYFVTPTSNQRDPTRYHPSGIYL